MVERLLQLPEGTPKVLGLDLQLDKHGAIWLLEVPPSALCLSVLCTCLVPPSALCLSWCLLVLCALCLSGVS